MRNLETRDDRQLLPCPFRDDPRLLACLLALLQAGALLAATTSRLTGTVVDSDGLPLPGVTVTLSSEVLIGGPQVGVTDDEGGFRFLLLPPGRYLVRTDLPGFVPAEVEARVALDRVAEVHVQTVPNHFAGSVEVTASSPVVDVTRVASGESYDEEFLQGSAIGMDGRSFLSVIGNAAGVAVAKGENANRNPKVMGSRPADNVFLIDGLNTTDPYTGTFLASVNFDAIREVSVQTAGYEAEFGQALGGVVNVVTKSGGNVFSGSLDLRYRDESLAEGGDHFDPDEMENSLRHLTATVGGPILRDRLWFFAAVEDVLARETPTGSPVTREVDSTPWSAKLTWQASAAVRATVKVASDPSEIENSNAGPFMTAEAGGRFVAGGELYQAEVDAVPSEDWLLSLQVGINRPVVDLAPMSGDLETPGWVDEDANDLVFVNYNTVDVSDRSSDQARVSATRFVDDLLGAHQFRAGVEYRRLATSYQNFNPGGQYYLVYELRDPVNNPDARGGFDLDGDGYTDHQMVRYSSGYEVPSTEVGDQWSAFLQDSWQPLPSLTVKPGVRFDRATYSNTLGDTVADLDSLQPRLGAAWDLFGTGTSVVRASWGRFMHPSTNNLPDLISGREFGRLTYVGYEHYCRFPGTGLCNREWLTANRAIDGLEVITIDAEGHEHYWYLRNAIGQDPFETVETLGLGNLEAPLVQNVSLAFEQQLSRASSVSVEYVDKRSRHLIEDTCRGNSWVWDGTVPPGEFDDPTTWTQYPEACSGYVLANVPGLRRDYDAVIVALDVRSEAYRLMGNYTYSRSTGNSTADAGWYATEGYDSFPLDFYNLQGSMDDDARHRVKLNVFWLLPLDLTLSFDYAWESASALDVTAECGRLGNLSGDGYDWHVAAYCLNEGSLNGSAYLEPRGSRRTPSTYDQLDLALSKGFRVRGVNLEVSASVVNVLGDEEPVRYWTQEYNLDFDWGQAMDWTRPRRYEIGLRVEF